MDTKSPENSGLSLNRISERLPSGLVTFVPLNFWEISLKVDEMNLSFLWLDLDEIVWGVLSELLVSKCELIHLSYRGNCHMCSAWASPVPCDCNHWHNPSQGDLRSFSFHFLRPIVRKETFPENTPRFTQSSSIWHHLARFFHVPFLSLDQISELNLFVKRMSKLFFGKKNWIMRATWYA